MVAGGDGNEDDSENDGNDDNDRRTFSAWSNFIVRILFHTLLLLALVFKGYVICHHSEIIY